MHNEIGYGRWFLKHLQEYERKLKRRVSVTEFAKYLGVSQPTLSFWLTEDRMPSGEIALRVCGILGDYSLLPLLGYIPPKGDLDHLPGSMRTRLLRALSDITTALSDKGITDFESPEAVDIATRIMSLHGFEIKDTVI